MKAFAILVLIALLTSCRKDIEIPHFSFSENEREWFIYEKGQQFKFKNSLGESLVYEVTDVEITQDSPEYEDTSRAKVFSYSQAYYTRLESSNDSIIIYFYKTLRPYTDLGKMKQTIRWHRMRNQFAYLSAIENNTQLESRTINGVTYPKVTSVLAIGNDAYSFTRFDKAFYDQKAGFIELIDINGASWKRE